MSQDTLRQLVSASILSRLDYCNSLLYMDCRGRLSLHSSACRMPLRGSFWACRHVTTSVLHSRHYTSCPFITGFSSRSRCSCTMHSLAGVQSTLRTLLHLHLLPVTPVDSNYDLPPDPTSSFLVAEQSLAVEPSQ